MQTKQITLTFDNQTYESAENILNEIGLEIQSAVNIMLKRINKEGGISFMLQNQTSFANNNNEPFAIQKNYDDEAIKRYSHKIYSFKKETTKITEEMRDHIWTTFLENKNLSYTEYQELAKKVSQDTGMSQGSAYIYFVILSCFMQGKFNTRTMKISDLEFYIKKIMQECSKNEFANTLKSLEESIPYWEDHIQGHFAQKVKNLVKQYKSAL